VSKFPLPLLLFSLPSATVFAQSPARKVAIIDGVRFKADSSTTVREADHFYKVVTQKLTAKGWAPSPPVSESMCQRASAGSDCLGYVTREAAADYVLRVTGDGNLMEGYSLRVEVYSPRTRHTQKTTNVCDVCVTDGIAQSTATISLDLLTDAVKDDAETARERRSASRDLVSGRSSVSEPTNLSWIPWSMVGVGAIGIGLGTWWLSKNGNSKDFHPASASPVVSNDYYSSKSLGLASVLGGAAMAAGGILWIALSPSSSASVIASPNHVAFNLRY
jgi:hypothetical protein